MKWNKYIALSVFLLLPFITKAQEVEMADSFRKEGKIYVVVAVAAVILAGIFVYLFMLDKKVTKIENQLKQK